MASPSGGIRTPRALFVPLALFALTVPLAAPALSTGTAPAFSVPVPLPMSSGFGEPSIAAAPDGGIYVTAPCPASPVWRSDNGGMSFAQVGTSRGSCGDSDISISPDGTVYVSDLLTNVPVSVSHDKGNTFPFVSQSIPGRSDRQWLATPANGVVFSAVNQAGKFIVARSDDGGVTWARHTAFTDASFPPPGNILAPTVSDVYVPYVNDALRLAISHDGGVTFTVRTVGDYAGYTGLGGTVLFPMVARDTAGTLYFAWSDNGDEHLLDGTRIRVSYSTDDGVTWAPARTLTSPGSLTQGTYNIFPWIVADAPGKVAVSWFEGVPPGGVRTMTDAAAATPWNVHVAYSQDANSPTASWTTQAATGTVYTGPICTIGTGCVPVKNPVAGNRVLLDFFEMTELPDGTLAIAFPGLQAPVTSAVTSVTQLYVIHQTAGPGLK